MSQATTPPLIFKVLSTDQWNASLSKDTIALSEADEQFIHFSEEDGVQRIIAKFFKEHKEVVVLSIDPKKLEGKLVYEPNYEGGKCYYHLYDGAITHASITSYKIAPVNT